MTPRVMMRLVLQGTQDMQVSADQEAPALEAALRRRKPDDHRLCLLPDVSHNMKHVKAAGEAGITGEIAPEMAAALNAWLP